MLGEARRAGTACGAKFWIGTAGEAVGMGLVGCTGTTEPVGDGVTTGDALVGAGGDIVCAGACLTGSFCTNPGSISIGPLKAGVEGFSGLAEGGLLSTAGIEAAGDS